MGLIKTVTEKPWERKGVIGGMVPEGTFATESERVALTFFLVIATVVFSLFMVSYYLRMELPDWEPLSEPAQLWFNTGLLIASSVLFQWSRNIVVRGHTRNLYTSFFGAGVLAILFIVAQMVTWKNYPRSDQNRPLPPPPRARGLPQGQARCGRLRRPRRPGYVTGADCC